MITTFRMTLILVGSGCVAAFHVAFISRGLFLFEDRTRCAFAFFALLSFPRKKIKRKKIKRKKLKRKKIKWKKKIKKMGILPLMAHTFRLGLATMCGVMWYALSRSKCENYKNLCIEWAALSLFFIISRHNLAWEDGRNHQRFASIPFFF